MDSIFLRKFIVDPLGEQHYPIIFKEHKTKERIKSTKSANIAFIFI
jgi:hypothetical protein